MNLKKTGQKLIHVLSIPSSKMSSYLRFMNFLRPFVEVFIQRIEAFNKEIKRYTKRKEQFTNQDALERFLVTRFLDYNYKFSKRCHHGFEQAKPELFHMFEKQVE